MNHDITSPSQPSINPSPLSRRRLDYIDRSQEVLSGIPVRPNSPVPKQQGDRTRISAPPYSAQAQNRPAPPRIASDWPVIYWLDVEVGTSGLKNLGNMGYMNAPIQCLSATVPFARFFTGELPFYVGRFAFMRAYIWLGFYDRGALEERNQPREPIGLQRSSNVCLCEAVARDVGWQVALRDPHRLPGMSLIHLFESATYKFY